MVAKATLIGVGCAAEVGVFALVSRAADLQTIGVFDGLTTLLPVPVAFMCGFVPRRIVGLLAVTWMAAAIEVTTGFNPFVFVLTYGPWFAGVIVFERQKVVRQLEELGRLIEEESEGVAEEAVRLERSRIARELHDIVAHCVSVMVVQAYAGERLVTADTTAAAQAFDHISDAANEAQREIGHLVALLATDETIKSRGLRPALADLLAGAEATGLDVSLRISGTPEALSEPATTVTYRIVQEGLTNALKHAPGASIVIHVDCADQVTVDVLNAASQYRPSLLGRSGGGNGLAGIRERVTGLGGTFEAGPNHGGNWRLSVRSPLL